MTSPLPALRDLQWSLDSDIVMGPFSSYNVSTFSFGPAAPRVQDADIQDADGERVGVDTRGGRLITIELNTDCYTEEDGLDALESFEGAWIDPAKRGTPGKLSVLRWRRGTRVRRAYGRPRDCLPNHERDWTGNIPITATFRVMEPYFYDDTENVEVVPLVPEQDGGLEGDLIGDIVSSGTGSGTRGFVIGGKRATWVPFVLYGPIVNPSIEFVGHYTVTLTTSIADGEYLLVDPSPWQRDVRSSSGANRAGALTADSQLLSEMRLPPGQHEAILRGFDPTGTARAVVYWRDCYASH